MSHFITKSGVQSTQENSNTLQKSFKDASNGGCLLTCSVVCPSLFLTSFSSEIRLRKRAVACLHRQASFPHSKARMVETEAETLEQQRQFAKMALAENEDFVKNNQGFVKQKNFPTGTFLLQCFSFFSAFFQLPSPASLF